MFGLDDEWAKSFCIRISLSGGVIFFVCPHGYVYAYKVLTLPESPRQLVDVLLSMMQPPNIVVYDFASGLAALS